MIGDLGAHLRHQDLMQSTFEALEAAPQAVIACINGYALAGGLELALSCDIVIADESAELGDEHIRRNLLPGAEARSGCLASWGCRARCCTC